MKIKTSRKSLAAFCLVAAFLLTGSGCKKYEDGPWFSLRSRKGRVVNSWCYELVLRNGLDVTTGLPELSIVYAESSLGFNDEYRFTTIRHYTDSLNFPPERFDGTWNFSENEDSLILVYDAPGPAEGDTQMLYITKLREGALWLEEDFGDNLYEYRLLPSDNKGE